MLSFMRMPPDGGPTLARAGRPGGALRGRVLAPRRVGPPWGRVGRGERPADRRAEHHPRGGGPGAAPTRGPLSDRARCCAAAAARQPQRGPRTWARHSMGPPHAWPRQGPEGLLGHRACPGPAAWPRGEGARLRRHPAGGLGRRPRARAPTTNADADAGTTAQRDRAARTSPRQKKARGEGRAPGGLWTRAF